MSAIAVSRSLQINKSSFKDTKSSWDGKMSLISEALDIRL